MSKNASRLLRIQWPDVNMFAEELQAILIRGWTIDDLETGSIDERYARLGATNAFTEDQSIAGRLTINSDDVLNPAIAVTHAGASSTQNHAGVAIVATSGAGGLSVYRNVATPASKDSLVRMHEAGNSDRLGVELLYAGSTHAMQITHSGSNGFGLRVANRGIHVTGDALFDDDVQITGDVSANDLELTGTLEVEGLTVRADADVLGILDVVGASNLHGATTIDNLLTLMGGLTVASGNVTVQTDVAVIGTSTLNGNVTVDADLDVTGDTTLGGDLRINGTDVNLPGGTYRGQSVWVSYLKSDSDLDVGNPSLGEHYARIHGHLLVEGNAEIQGDFRIQQLTVPGALNVDGVATLGGSAKIENGLTVSGGIVGQGVATFENDVRVNGGFISDGAAQLLGSAAIQNGLSLYGGLVVASGNATCQGGLTAAAGFTVAGGMVSDGGIDVNSGTLHVKATAGLLLDNPWNPMTATSMIFQGFTVQWQLIGGTWYLTR